MSAPSLSIFWFRRDLRLHDNAGLYYALKENKNVLPVFIFDTIILDKLENKKDRRLDFIHQALQALQKKLAALGSGLHVYQGDPVSVFKKILSQHKVNAVYTNHDYEPYARERDETIRGLIESQGIIFKTSKDQCIFDKDEVLKPDGKPYTVFTPYSRKWKSQLQPFYYRSYPVEKYFSSLHQFSAPALPSLTELGFEETGFVAAKAAMPESLLLAEYKDKRNFPALKGTSRLSMHLRFGTLSIRELVRRALPLSATWLNELIWREFYMMILWHFPHAAEDPFKKEYRHIAWVNNEADFDKWCRGMTGFPIVDAGMRELNETGFMHNRVRMIVSSFLVKDLLIDYRWGEAYFAQKLNDFDLSANNGGWQWAAGTGCDAAPYFRIFNPEAQQKKFDPELKYILKWVPEYGTKNYPPPMIDHAAARLRALRVYKEGIESQRQMRLL